MEFCTSCGADLPANEQSCAYCGHTQLVIISTISTPKLSASAPPQIHTQREKPVSKETSTNYEPSHPAPETTKIFSPKVKVFFLAAIFFVILGSTGVGITYYLLNRPQPIIHVSSEYKVGNTLAGATGTVFHINGSKFSNSSVITFLLDGTPTLSRSTIYSDANGNINVDLAVMENWPIGSHMLTARDANNYTTEQGFSIMVVPPGQAHTPGPHGAPPDDASFRIGVKVTQITYAETGQSYVTSGVITYFDITGQPDPAGGTVCRIGSITDRSINYVQNGEQITQTTTEICNDEGLYKGGQLTLTQTVTQWKFSFSSGRTCTLHKPYNTRVIGTFINPTTIRGETNLPRIDFDCADSTSVRLPSSINTWEGNIVKD